MKITNVIARFLLGLIFLTFGLNGFLHFLPASLPSGTAGQFVGALFVSHYLVVVFLLQLVAAVLLVINRYVPLALAWYPRRRRGPNPPYPINQCGHRSERGRSRARLSRVRDA